MTAAALAYVASQVRVDPTVFGSYDWYALTALLVALDEPRVLAT